MSRHRRRGQRAAVIVEYGLATAVLALIAVALARFSRVTLGVLESGADQAAVRAGWRF